MVMHADATYKLIWEGMPVLLVGTTDKDRHFHPFGISVCSNQKTADFRFIFQAVLNGTEQQNIQIRPSILVSDAAPEIRNAFKHIFDVFGETQLIMCWAHVRRNIEKHLHLVAHEFHEEVLTDLETLQLSSNPEIFAKAKQLFIKKWGAQKKQKEFLKYMNEQWFRTHETWYEGAALLVPSTNNALESFNLVVKREETLRER